MAVYNPHEHSARTLEVARAWRDRCMVGDGSIFAEQQLWTEAKLRALHSAFHDNPQHGSDPFYTKLARQLQPAGPEVQKLAAECLWLLLLFIASSGFSPGLKRQRIEEVWRLSGEEFVANGLVSNEAMDGIGWPGTAFLTRIPDEFGYLLTAMLEWKRLSPERRTRLLRFVAWLGVIARPSPSNTSPVSRLGFWCFSRRD